MTSQKIINLLLIYSTTSESNFQIIKHTRGRKSRRRNDQKSQNDYTSVKKMLGKEVSVVTDKFDSKPACKLAPRYMHQRFFNSIGETQFKQEE